MLINAKRLSQGCGCVADSHNPDENPLVKKSRVTSSISVVFASPDKKYDIFKIYLMKVSVLIYKYHIIIWYGGIILIAARKGGTGF
ncbi:MAG: hypothetical protein ACERKO_00945 [Acetanaerobacterium sp.]